MDRRNLLKAICLTPLVAVPAVAKPQAETTEQRLIALIDELENAPGYETCGTHWTKAFEAAEIRKILNLPVPESEHLEGYYHGLEEQKEWGRRFDAFQAARKAT